MGDKVHNPEHYQKGGYECIDIIRAVLGRDGFESYCRGNALKYLWREDKKNGTEDIEKAITYLGYLVESRKTAL